MVTEGLIETFKATMAEYPSGVVIVTTIDQSGRKQGFTATSFSSLSMDPPSIFVCLAKSALSYDAFVNSHHFAVNFIDAADSNLALRFARRGEDKFSDLREWRTEHGVPILADAVAYIECETENHYVSGDHAILVGRVLQTVASHDREVLVHYRRKFGRVNLPVDPQATLLSDVSFDGGWLT